MTSVLSFLKPAGYAVIGLFLGGLVAMIAGENPLDLFRIIFFGVAGTPYDSGIALYYMTILILSGLAVGIPYKAAIFNIGGEGQMLMGSLAAALMGLILGDDVSVMGAAVFGMLAAFFGGSLWAAVAAWIRAYRGGHEVISTIMLNFVAAGLTGWLTLSYFKATDSQSPETSELSSVWRWQKIDWFDGAPVTYLTLITLLLAVFVFVVFAKMTAGYKIKAAQVAPKAAHIAGIDVRQVRFWTLVMGGGFAGLAGGVMVLAASGRFTLDMSDGFGFMGIPVALLGKGHPLGVVASAALFAVLHHGSSNLDLEATYVTRDLAQVIQALVVIVVVSERVFTRSFWRQIFAAKVF